MALAKSHPCFIHISVHFVMSLLLTTCDKQVKRLLEKTKDGGENFSLALAEYCNAPRADGPCINDLSYNRQGRSCISPEPQREVLNEENRRERKHQKIKGRVERTKRLPLPPLPRDSEVWMLDKRNKWTIPAKVFAARPNGKSYILETKKGIYLRKRRYLRPKNEKEEEEHGEAEEWSRQTTSEESIQVAATLPRRGPVTRSKTKALRQKMNRKCSKMTITSVCVLFVLVIGGTLTFWLWSRGNDMETKLETNGDDNKIETSEKKEVSLFHIKELYSAQTSSNIMTLIGFTIIFLIIGYAAFHFKFVKEPRSVEKDAERAKMMERLMDVEEVMLELGYLKRKKNMKRNKKTKTHKATKNKLKTKTKDTTIEDSDEEDWDN